MPVSRKHSLSEISRHTSKKDCWLIIHGKVYDVTTFLDDHPGGEYVLLQASGGGDATEAFEEVGHSTTASTMMEGYLIGTVGGDEGAAAGGGAPKTTGAVTATAQRTSPSSFSFSDLLLPVLVLSLALGVWYYLNFYSKANA